MSLDTAAAVATMRGLTQKFSTGFRTSTPFYPRVCMNVQSNGRDEKYGMMGEVPQMREWLGKRQAHTLRAATYELVNRKFELTLQVQKDDLADQRVSMYEASFTSGGQRAMKHPDKLFADTIVAGATTPCWDGQFFYDTDHVFGKSGSQSNKITSPAVDQSAPTLAEWKTAFRKAVRTMASFKDDQGESLNQPTFEGYNNLIALLPIEQRDAAHDAIDSAIVSNSTNVVIDRPDLVTMTHLTDATSFYVFFTGDPIRPIIFQERQPLKAPQFQGLDDYREQEVLWMTDARYAMGYAAWWNSVKVTFVAP